MGTAATRFSSEAFSKGLREYEGKIIRTAALIAFLSSILVAVPMFIFSYPIVSDLLRVPTHLQNQASIALKFTSVSLVFGILGNVFNSPQFSRLRMDLNTLINAGAKISMALITPIVLYLGGGIVEAVMVVFFTTLFLLIAHLFVSGRLLRELYQTTISKDLIKPLMKFGSSLLLWAIAITLVGNLEKIFLTRLVSVQSLAYYSIAFTFANMTTMVSMSIVQTLIPAFSQLLTPEKRIELDALFSRGLRVSLIGLLPSVMFLFVIAKPFFTIWLGEEFGRESVYPFYILLSGIFFSIIVYVPNGVLTAYGRPDIFAKTHWIEFLPYALAAYWLIISFGIFGAALVWSLREILNAFLFIWMTKRIVGVSFNFISQFAVLSLGLLIISPPMLFAAFYNNFSLWLVPLVTVCMGLYLLLIWKKMVNQEEKVWIENKLQGFWGRNIFNKMLQ